MANGVPPESSPAPVMPQKGELCHLGAFHGSLHDKYPLIFMQLITLPKQTRKIFRALAADIPFQQSVDACARLYQLSLLVRRYSASASLAYRVAAIDAACQTRAVRKTFSEFMREHLPPTSDVDDILEMLYGKVRSGHFHAGQAPLDEHGQVLFHPFFTSDYVVQAEVADQGFYVTRQALVTWLLSEVEKRVSSE